MKVFKIGQMVLMKMCKNVINCLKNNQMKVATMLMYLMR